jgi:hypothetical protein
MRKRNLICGVLPGLAIPAPLTFAEEAQSWLSNVSVHGRVDEQDYNDGTQNDPPIGNLNARYRCFLAKPFHDVSPQIGR